MNDNAFERGDFTPADHFEPAASAAFAPADEAIVAPNGFVKMGLAPELMRAI